MGKAIFVERTGDASVLELREHDPGPPGKGQARVVVHVVGVNFIDVYFRTGLYKRPLPFIEGLEGVGVVEAIGEGVDHVRVGERVAWASAQSSYATHLVAAADGMVPIPDGVSDDEAATAMVQGMTAHYLVYGTHQTRPGDTMLVHAAAGGVGLLLTQLLKRAGARVIGTCSTPEKEALAREAGADEVILYSKADFAKETKRLTNGRGVDVVYDSVGATTFDGSLSSLRPRGLLVSYGQSSGPVPPLDPQRLTAHGSLFLTRPSLNHYTLTREELGMRATAVFEAVKSRELEVRIGARFPLERAADAHRALEGRQTTGKVLLEV